MKSSLCLGWFGIFVLLLVLPWGTSSAGAFDLLAAVRAEQLPSPVAGEVSSLPPPAPESAVAAKGASLDEAAPQLQAVRAVVDRQSVTLALKISGEFSYFPTFSGERLLLVDLPGVRSREASTSHLLDSALVSSYRLVSYLREGEPGARLEVLLKGASAAEYRRSPGKLEVYLAPKRPTPVVSAAPAVRAGPADRLEKISFSRAAQFPAVRVAANGTLKYKAFTLGHPHRLVLDMPVANHVPQRSLTAEGMSPLRQVRVHQFQQKPPLTRVVLELEDGARYELRPGGNGLEVELRSWPAPTQSRPKASAWMMPASAASPEAQVPLLSGAMAASVDKLFASMGRLMAAPKVELAGPSGEQASAAVAPATAVAVSELPVSAAAAPPQPPAVVFAQAIQQPVAAPPAAPGPVAQRYTGEPVSINVKDVDLKDFFRLIHEISGLNLVLDPGVRGTVTMVLDDVPWDQALDIVLRNNQLDKVLEGNVLRIATLDTMKKEQAAMAELAAAQQAAAPRVTITKSINYAKAVELMPTVRKFLSPRADVIADARTNTLIITDVVTGFETLDQVLRQLDKRTQQVEIEARVVAASREFVRELGSQFGFQTSAAGRRTLFGGNPIGENSSPIETRPIDPIFSVAGGQAIPLFSNFPAAGANVGQTFAHSSPNFHLDLILTAAERRGIGRTLSRPKVITQNNRAGVVKQGVQIPVQTTVNNTVSVQFVDVTLRLTVTPQITAENTIFLTIDVTNSAIDPGIARINGIPALATQQATTEVLVNDGGTVVFGGVILNENNLTIQQVPLLGSIPVIGHLFKRTGVSTRTSELLFFVTPKIV